MTQQIQLYKNNNNNINDNNNGKLQDSWFVKKNCMKYKKKSDGNTLNKSLKISKHFQ